MTSKREWSSSGRESLVTVLGCILSRLFSNPSDILPTNSADITVFHTGVFPCISISKFLERIAFYTDVSNECLVMSLIQVSRVYYSPFGKKCFL